MMGVGADIRSRTLCGAPPRRHAFIGVGEAPVHMTSVKLQLLKPAEDVGLVALDEWTDVDRRRRRLEGATSHLEISLDIRVERFEVSVAQNVLDGHGGNSGLQHVHGFRVPEAVRTDPLSVQGWILADCEPPVMLDHKRRAGSCQRRSSGVSEEAFQVAG